jgi:hypothetical protein
MSDRPAGEPAEPRILKGLEVLPPMEPNPAPPRPGNGQARPKGKAERRSSAERFHTINAFADVALADLDRAEIALWLLLWRDTKPNGLASASQADLARRAGCNVRTVRRALAGLLRAGLVQCVSQGGLPLRVSVYRVLRAVR